MLIRQRGRQRKLQKLSATQCKLCRCFNFLVFRKGFGPHHDVILAPNDQVSPALYYAAFLRMPHKIVESVQGTLQLSIRKYAGQARYCQRKQQHEYEYSEDNLDQRKTPQSLHRRTYSMDAKSQHVGNRLTSDEIQMIIAGDGLLIEGKHAAAFWFIPITIPVLGKTTLG